METRGLSDRHCDCGCGEFTRVSPATCRRDGYVKGEPRRFVNGHGSRKLGPDYEESDRGHSTPCWMWLKSRTAAGYGRIAMDGVEAYAHRVYYERAKGPIAEGLQIDHLCRNRACVNPTHLEPVPPVVNTRRGVIARHGVSDIGGYLAGRVCTRGHDELVLRNGQKCCRACDRERARKAA